VQYIQVDSDTFIQYDDSNQSASIVSRSSLEDQLSRLRAAVPPMPSDDDLLTWAKSNYPGLAEITLQQQNIADLQAVVDQLDQNSIDVTTQVAKLGSQVTKVNI
jgi:hypothetical protein